jgi:hypothetical protein
MNDREQLPPVRFRAVIEMSFPNADRWDPTDYDSVIEKWRKSLEENPTFMCKDVVIWEILAIGGQEDDYETWRHQDLSHVRPGIRSRGSIETLRSRSLFSSVGSSRGDVRGRSALLS